MVPPQPLLSIITMYGGGPVAGSLALCVCMLCGGGVSAVLSSVIAFINGFVSVPYSIGHQAFSLARLSW